jgi:hypothetical protein
MALSKTGRTAEIHAPTAMVLLLSSVIRVLFARTSNFANLSLEWIGLRWPFCRPQQWPGVGPHSGADVSNTHNAFCSRPLLMLGLRSKNHGNGHWVKLVRTQEAYTRVATVPLLTSVIRAFRPCFKLSKLSIRRDLITSTFYIKKDKCLNNTS